jgi:hypothetical protein
LHIIGEGRLILGGYLNFTVNRREICGELARVDKQVKLLHSSIGGDRVDKCGSHFHETHMVE